jgi:WD40 repeat protein
MFPIHRSWDESLKIWDAKTGKEKRTLKGHGSYVSSVAATGEATRAELAAALQDKVETGEIQRPIATSDKPIRDAVKNLLDIKLIRELPNSKGILQINS